MRKLFTALAPLAALALMAGGPAYAAPPDAAADGNANAKASQGASDNATAQPRASAKGGAERAQAASAKDASAGAQGASSGARSEKKDVTKGPREAAKSDRTSSRAIEKPARDAAASAEKTDRDPQPPAANVNREGRERREAGREGAQERRRMSFESGRERREGRRGSRRTAVSIGLEFGRVSDRGLLISNLPDDSIAFRTGLRRGDVIISINGNRVRAVEDFDRLVFVEPRERVEVVVLRDGREEVILLEPDVIYVDSGVNDDLALFGVMIDEQVTDRIVIVKVFPDTPAFAAGLRAGDVLVSWHGQRISSPRAFVQLVGTVDTGRVDFEFTRESKTMHGEAKFSDRDSARGNREGGREQRRQPREADSSRRSGDRQGAAGAEPAERQGTTDAGEAGNKSGAAGARASEGRDGDKGTKAGDQGAAAGKADSGAEKGSGTGTEDNSEKKGI